MNCNGYFERRAHLVASGENEKAPHGFPAGLHREIDMAIKMIIASAAIALSICAGGCASVSVASDYDWVKQQDFAYGNVDWVVLDRTADSRVLLRPSLGDSAAAGKFAKDIGAQKKIDGFDEVIAAWFKSKGRDCEITKTDVVIETWRQYHYSCKA